MASGQAGLDHFIKLSEMSANPIGNLGGFRRPVGLCLDVDGERGRSQVAKAKVVDRDISPGKIHQTLSKVIPFRLEKYPKADVVPFAGVEIRVSELPVCSAGCDVAEVNVGEVDESLFEDIAVHPPTPPRLVFHHGLALAAVATSPLHCQLRNPQLLVAVGISLHGS